jgi:hypothetical protein
MCFFMGVPSRYTNQVSARQKNVSLVIRKYEDMFPSLFENIKVWFSFAHLNVQTPANALYAVQLVRFHFSCARYSGLHFASAP